MRLSEKNKTRYFALLLCGVVIPLLLDSTAESAAAPSPPTSGGTSKYGHPGDCDCGDLYYCEDEYIEHYNNSDPGDEFFGMPLYVNVNQPICGGTGNLVTSADVGNVEIGSWSGEIAVGIEGGLPVGYKLEVAGKVSKSGEFTEEYRYQSEVACESAGPCITHSAKVGPGYTTIETTVQYSHRCWGTSGSCSTSLKVSCGHHENLTSSVSVTILSSKYKSELVCARALTSDEKETCGCVCDEE